MSPGTSKKPELVIGLVGAVGTDLSAAGDAVKETLVSYGYRVEPIKLSALMKEVKGGDSLGRLAPEDVRIRGFMDAGDEIRRQSDRNDAMAALAIGTIVGFRREKLRGEPASNTAFLLDSLKHPAEIELLRSVYRDRFTLISVHSPTDDRRRAVEMKIARSHGMPEHPERFENAASEIMDRDEHDDDHGFGQNVREAFVKGDVYVSTNPPGELAADVGRYFRLFFGDPFVTPRPDEFAMFQAHTAALRSADLSRQVGAAICTDDGEIVALGCNEVPKVDGGQYWPEESPDRRDFQLGYDSNVKYRNEALREAFDQLQSAGILALGAKEDDFLAALHGSRLTNLTEFGRTVHAEMAALLDAARRGAPVAGRYLFATTFPCHNCARHIVAAGLREVIYREPYEKSLAGRLHEDAIVVDTTTEPNGKVLFRRFVGVGPPKYSSLFEMPRRKDGDGNKVEWSQEAASPRLVTTGYAYMTNEWDVLADFEDVLESVDLGKGVEHGAT